MFKNCERCGYEQETATMLGNGTVHIATKCCECEYPLY